MSTYRALVGVHMERHGFINIPNTVSIFRLLLVPVLWVMAFMDMPRYVGVGLLLAGLSDALDGFIARRWGMVSAYGSRLDSIADVSVIVSAVFWVALLMPGIILDHKLLVTVWVLLEASAILVGWVKFRRIANLHLYSAKAAGVIAYAFVIVAFVFGYNEVLFYVALAALIVASAEAFTLELLCSGVDEHMKSIIHAYREGRLV
jgi:cardiolipin synthase